MAASFDNTQPRPSSAYVRGYVVGSLHALLDGSVPPPLYLAARNWFDDLIRDCLNTPPIMAYDALRKPTRKKLARLQYFADTLGLTLPAQLESELEEALDKAVNEIAKLYVRDQISEIAAEFQRAGIDANARLNDVARQHGFTTSNNNEWFSRGVERVSRRSMAHALALAKGPLPPAR
jgi:hypothetical protein